MMNQLETLYDNRAMIKLEQEKRNDKLKTSKDRGGNNLKMNNNEEENLNMEGQMLSEGCS
jgi:hypothetical protein